MANSTREIRRRIRSVSSTKKVTKAMELVSSAKMRKTVQAVLATRAYAHRAWDVLVNLSRATDPDVHPLLRRRTGGRTGLVLVSTSRGFVGGFNTFLINAVVEHLKKADPAHRDTDVILLGKRGRAIVTQHGYPGIAEFEKQDVVTHVDEVRPLAKLVVDDFTAEKYDKIILAYTDFVSTLRQKPRVRQLLPIERDLELGSVGFDMPDGQHVATEYLFEPNPDDVLETILPRLVEMQLFQAVLESNASEHAARMVAMRSASDAANDLIDDLTLSYNQARQAGITQDLSEISASRAALGS